MAYLPMLAPSVSHLPICSARVQLARGLRTCSARLQLARALKIPRHHGHCAEIGSRQKFQQEWVQHAKGKPCCTMPPRCLVVEVRSKRFSRRNRQDRSLMPPRPCRALAPWCNKSLDAMHRRHRIPHEESTGRMHDKVRRDDAASRRLQQNRRG